MSEELETPAGDAITERDKIALFIGPNAPKYLEFYDELIAYEEAVAKREQEPDGADNGTASIYRPVAVNSAAFWLSPFWLLYRKLYLWGIGWVLTLTVTTYSYLSLFDDWQLFFNWQSALFLWLAISVFAAVTFEKHYVFRARKLVAVIEDQGLAHDVEYDLIKRTGGTSALSVCVVLIIMITLAATSIAVDRYNATQMLNECEDEALDPIALQGVVKLLAKHNVTYQNLEARSVTQDFLYESSEYERICNVVVYIDEKSMVLQLVITWMNEVGGEKSFAIEDRNEAIPGLLRARENAD